MILVILLMIGLSAGTQEEKVILASEVEAIIRAGGPAEFDDYTIMGDLNLSGLKIERPVHFNRTIFQDSVTFNSSTFNGTAYFRSSVFNRDAYFRSSEFNGYAYFDGYAYFGPYFRTSVFNGYANFESSVFNGDADFSHSTFKGTASFVYSAFNGIADFGSSTFKEDALFYRASFKNEISLESTKYEKLYIRWDRNRRLVYDETAYQLLIDNLRKLGFIVDADVCYYQFRAGQVLHQNPLNEPILTLLNFGSWIFYGFGMKPLYPVIWSGFFVVLFGFLWMRLESNEPESAIVIKAWAWVNGVLY